MFVFCENYLTSKVNYQIPEGLQLFVVKDSIDVEGFPTTCGHIKLKDNIAKKSNMVIKKLLSNGYVCYGKCNMDVMSYGWFGENKFYGDLENHKYPHLTSGGSSSGCAVALSNELISFSIGEDTIGSIRIPSSLAGLYSYRPVNKYYSNDNMFKITKEYDQIGIISRSYNLINEINSVITSSRESRTIDNGITVSIPFNILKGKVTNEILNTLEDIVFELNLNGVEIFFGNIDVVVTESSKLLRCIVEDEVDDLINFKLKEIGVSGLFNDMIDIDRYIPERIIKDKEKIREDILREVSDYFLVSKSDFILLPVFYDEKNYKDNKIKLSDNFSYFTAISSLNKLSSFTIPIESKLGYPLGFELLFNPIKDDNVLLAKCGEIVNFIK
ncbi:amidase family protein [Aliivibrio fischeri]|uniref:amidase family protein n=1 Tax=Aliivibrio fischeri TaxID=668 RepID=UPI001EEE0D40|nr:amidase family protein [Aliivibrio fischeri]MCE7534924.1 hypothetical protein [Aliivibrio fischeri]MCE7559366.1 hypothetical protein [Aliivibrio fischeri]